MASAASKRAASRRVGEENPLARRNARAFGGSDVTGPITIDPPGNAGVASYGVGAGNVEINMRTVIASAFPTIYGNVFDGGNPCSPPESGTLYVCVTQTLTAETARRSCCRSTRSRCTWRASPRRERA